MHDKRFHNIGCYLHKVRKMNAWWNKMASASPFASIFRIQNYRTDFCESWYCDLR
jgi:hypothetical protein